VLVLREALKLSTLDFTLHFYSWVWVGVFVTVVAFLLSLCKLYGSWLMCCLLSVAIKHPTLCSLCSVIEGRLEACIVFKKPRFYLVFQACGFSGLFLLFGFGLHLSVEITEIRKQPISSRALRCIV